MCGFVGFVTTSYAVKIVSTVLGYLGSFLFAFCNVPTIKKVYANKSANDIPYGFILMSVAANMCCAEFVLYTNIVKDTWQIPLYFNYGIAWICCIWLFYLKEKFSNYTPLCKTIPFVLVLLVYKVIYRFTR